MTCRFCHVGSLEYFHHFGLVKFANQQTLLSPQAPQHLYLCLFRERSPPIGFFLPQKTRISQENPLEEDLPRMCFFGWYIHQSELPFFHRFHKMEEAATVANCCRRLFFCAVTLQWGALSTNACRSFHFASSGMFPIQSFLAGSSVLPRLSGWSSVGTQIRRANGTEIKATFSCGLRFPLPLPLPLKANLSPGVVEAPVKHPAKHLPRAPKHWRHHHAIIVGHHALHNQRKPGILDKRSFPHPIIIHHRISNHWKKQ